MGKSKILSVVKEDTNTSKVEERICHTKMRDIARRSRARPAVHPIPQVAYGLDRDKDGPVSERRGRGRKREDAHLHDKSTNKGLTSNDNNPGKWGRSLLLPDREGLGEFLVGVDGLHHEADRGGIGDVGDSGAAAAAGEKATETTGAVNDGRARITRSGEGAGLAVVREMVRSIEYWLFFSPK
jgi:hypothetical protein